MWKSGPYVYGHSIAGLLILAFEIVTHRWAFSPPIRPSPYKLTWDSRAGLHKGPGPSRNLGSKTPFSWTQDWTEAQFFKFEVCGCHVVRFYVFSNFYWLDLHDKNRVAIEKSTMKYLQKSGWKSDLPWFSYGYQKCKLVGFWIGYIGPPNCVHRWV